MGFHSAFGDIVHCTLQDAMICLKGGWLGLGKSIKMLCITVSSYVERCLLFRVNGRSSVYHRIGRRFVIDVEWKIWPLFPFFGEQINTAYCRFFRAHHCRQHSIYSTPYLCWHGVISCLLVFSFGFYSFLHLYKSYI